MGTRQTRENEESRRKDLRDESPCQNHHPKPEIHLDFFHNTIQLLYTLKVRIQSRPLRNFHNTKNIMGGGENPRNSHEQFNSHHTTTIHRRRGFVSVCDASRTSYAPQPFTANAGSFLCATQVAPTMHAKRASSLNVERSETTPPSPQIAAWSPLHDAIPPGPSREGSHLLCSLCRPYRNCAPVEFFVILNEI